jgi:hypothetical protein
MDSVTEFRVTFKFILRALIYVSLVKTSFCFAGALGASPDTNQNLKNDPSRDISRLNYYAHQKVLNLSLRLLSPISGINETSTNDKVTSSTTTSFTSFDGSLSFGLTDRIRFGFSQAFLMTSQNHASLLGQASSIDTSSYGFADPNFNLSFRFLNPRNFGWSGDLLVGGSPSSSNHSLTSQAQIGDNNRGYSTATSSLSIYNSQKQNDVLVSFAATKEFQGSATSDVPANSFTRDESWTYSYVFADRLILLPFYIQAELNAVLAKDTKQTLGQNPPFIVKYISSPMTFAPKIIFGARINEKASLEVEYIRTEFNTTSSQNNSNLASGTSISLSTLAVRLKAAY